MLKIDTRTARQLNRDLLDAEERLPELPRSILRACVVNRLLLRECGEEEKMLAQWEQGTQSLVFNGPLIVDLSPEALFALVAHEAAHIYLAFRGMASTSEEERVSDLASQWGADVSALYGETGRGVYAKRRGR